MSIAEPRKSGSTIVIAVVVLAIGAALAIPAGVVAAVRAVRAIATPSVVTPGSVDRHLGSGRWLIYQSAGGGGFVLPTTLSPDEVDIIGPDGAQVSATQTASEATITRNGDLYAPVLEFHAQTSGTYRLRFTTRIPSRVLISRPLGHTIRDVGGPLVIVGLGGLIIMLGIILLIIGLVRRTSGPVATTAPLGPVGTPPGWYPDPSRPGGQRWWDGSRWTDHSV